MSEVESVIAMFFVLVAIMLLMGANHKLKRGYWFTPPTQATGIPPPRAMAVAPAQAAAASSAGLAGEGVGGKGGKSADAFGVIQAAVDRLPRSLAVPAANDWAIPLLHDGTQWHYWDPRKDGFMLVCGDTGSGKGNALQLIALQIAAHGPELVQLYILDAKDGMDYGALTRIAHVHLYTVQPTPDDAGTLTEGCAVLTELRSTQSALIRTSGARNMVEYAERVGKTLPLTVVLADEIAEFTGDQHAAIATLARMGRASGFVVIAATQYPTAEVVPSQVQANMPNRLAFRQASPHYTPIALRRSAKDATACYEPAYIPRTAPGVGVWRVAGTEVLGKAPEITDNWRQRTIDGLVQRWPKAAEIRSGRVTSLRKAEPNNEARNEAFTAAESAVTGSNGVSNPAVEPAEVVLVAQLRSKGMPPSAIAKKLPRYTPERYGDFKARADLIIAMLEAPV